MQPLAYLTTTGGLVWTAACVLIGFVMTWLAYRIINTIPAAWLCDYNETPSAELLSGARVKYVGSGIVVSILAAAALVLCRLQFNKGYDIYFVVFVLIIMLALMIAVCDLKYTIIPDQFTIALAILGLLISVYDLIRGFGLLHTAWWSPLAGAAIGGGAMLLIDFIGMLIYKRTGMGFGDVKLFAAIGLLTGFPGTFLAFILSMLTGTVFFVGILLYARLRRPSPETEPAADVLPTDTPAPADTPVPTEPAEAAESVEAAEATEPAETAEPADESGYLAFGPYIALAVIAYLCFYDLIYYLVEQYLKLF